MKIFGFHGYNIKFSPKNPRLICVGGANYGLQGNNFLSSKNNFFKAIFQVEVQSI